MVNFNPAIQAFLKLPGARTVAGITRSSPLHLFDAEQAAKAGWGKGYFKGRSLDVSQEGAYSMTKTDSFIGGRRKKAAWAAGGLLGANVLGFDPFGATSMADTALGATFHAAAGGTMYNLGGRMRYAGVGYFGLMGINALRSGNQWGPF
jgi:hypothetical protein